MKGLLTSVGLRNHTEAIAVGVFQHPEVVVRPVFLWVPGRPDPEQPPHLALLVGGVEVQVHPATLARGIERFERGTVRVGSIVIRCYEFDRMLAFWSEALGYEPREPAEDGWVVLRKPEGGGPNLSLERVAQPFDPHGRRGYRGHKPAT